MTSDSSTPAPTKVLVLDEFYSYLDSERAMMKEKLRSIEGIPNASYLVKDGKVFVFDMLVELVLQHQKQSPSFSVVSTAIELLPSATVSADEAIQTWSIMPTPYDVKPHPEGGFAILHSAFNAWLPPRFVALDDADGPLAELLLGKVLPGDGDFFYQGQAMTLCNRLDINGLPAMPELVAAADVAHGVNTDNVLPGSLWRLEYEPGFSPVSKTLFDETNRRQMQWFLRTEYAEQQVLQNMETLWALTKQIDFSELGKNYANDASVDKATAAELALTYPELQSLSDRALFRFFDAFQANCLYMRDWDVERENDFLFYLLGNMAVPGSDEHKSLHIGRWVAYSLLCGDSIEQSLQVARASALYDEALATLAKRISSAMLFLRERKDNPTLSGPHISTFADIFRLARKWNVTARPA